MDQDMTRCKLKPCPFCGSKEIRKLATVIDCTIWCNQCRCTIIRENYIKRNSLAETLHEAEPEAINAWNRRAEDPEIERLRKKVSALEKSNRNWRRKAQRIRKAVKDGKV